MCLDRLKNKGHKEWKYEKEGLHIIGYKAFRKRGRRLPRTVIWGNNKPMPLNKWLNEADYRFGSSSSRSIECECTTERYFAGFHVVLTESAARNWGGQVYVVKVRKIVALGYQEGDRTMVAKEMMILRKVES